MTVSNYFDVTRTLNKQLQSASYDAGTAREKVSPLMLCLKRCLLISMIGMRDGIRK